MLDGVVNGGSAALRDAEERDGLGGTSALDDGLDVGEPLRGPDVLDVPFRHSAAALVVADEAIVLGEEAHPMPPHGAVPIELKMRQPVRCFDERVPGPGLRPGQRDSVASLREAYRLLHRVRRLDWCGGV